MDPPIQDAATVIVLRRGDCPAILMGQRGATAAFMPSKFVFPGGAVDANDGIVPILGLDPMQATALQSFSRLSPAAIAAAAIRELWEETGQILGTTAPWTDPPQGWRGFAATGHRPTAHGMRFFFRAVTPAGRPRRFDARFFIVDADALVTDPDDFTRAEDELSHLHWVDLHRARDLDLPFITEVALAELVQHLSDPDAPLTVPFFNNDDEQHLVTRLGGIRPLDTVPR
ncbi:NUDIX hydrolase [Loktanella sp. SALINAS62]|nr:NUDIX hydrolase [Loktanella sp. SALINAS62]